jgi:type VI secretion system secreted protein Hcp
MPIYMKVPEILGDVTTKGWEQWIALDSCSLGCTRDVKPPSGKTQSREGGAVHVSDIQVSKGYDCSSSKLLQETLTSTGKIVKIQFLQSKGAGGGATLQTYLELELEGCMFSNWSMGGGGGDGGGKPAESLTLNYAKISYKAIEYDRMNKAKDPLIVSYDVGTTEAS